jgi:enoyl-CoA hydratase/carnithine racemase
MEYTHLIAGTDDGHVGSITLNRPEKMNTLNSQLAAELHACLTAMDADPQVRVIVLKGAGRAFCAGIDVSELAGKSPLEYHDWVGRMERPLVVISQLKTPVIAQVHGVAAANGMGLVAAADLAIAADNTRMGLTAINVGLNCVGPVIPVSRCVGRKKALELLLYGDLIKAPEALSLGLINRLVPEDQLGAEALAWAQELARKSPLAVQVAKSAFYAAEDMTYAQQFDHMNEAFARLCSTADAKEGVAAFFEKRVPQWREK